MVCRTFTASVCGRCQNHSSPLYFARVTIKIKILHQNSYKIFLTFLQLTQYRKHSLYNISSLSSNLYIPYKFLLINLWLIYWHITNNYVGHDFISYMLYKTAWTRTNIAVIQDSMNREQTHPWTENRIKFKKNIWVFDGLSHSMSLSVRIMSDLRASRVGRRMFIYYPSTCLHYSLPTLKSSTIPRVIF